VTQDIRDPREGRLLHVSNLQFWGSLCASLTVFLFATGPLWRHAADIGRLDTAIFWSYGAIPLLIAACLLWSQRWTARGFLLDTLALTVTKYVVTSMVAIVFWASVGDPKRMLPAPRAAAASVEGHRAEPSATPTVIDPARTGTLGVTVVFEGGRPASGAMTWIARGLEAYAFAVPADPLVLANDGKGILPALAAAQTGQSIEGRSGDGRLHTLVVRRDGAALFNVPLLSSGAPTRVRASDTPDATGLATVRCNVHPGVESESHLVLLAHPFHGASDADGRLTFLHLPSGVLTVAATRDGEHVVEAEVRLEPGQAAEARLTLPAR
jgi:hypothetical protein